METIRHIILFIAIVSLFAACSKDAESEQGRESDPPVRIVGLTRTALGDTDFGNIRVLLNDGATTSEGVFKYDGVSEWTTQLKLKSGTRTYRLYGFMPDDPTLNSSITSIDDDKAVMGVQGLSPVTTQDFCVITGVRLVDNASDMTSAVRGNFSFEYASNRQNYLNLLFDHLYGHVVFKMEVGTDYNAVRTIKVKSMQLQLRDISQVRADITLTNGVGIGSVSYTATGANEMKLDIRTTEQTLTTTSTEICSGYVIPDPALLADLRLVTEFDVFDKKGNKIAERTAINQLSVSLSDLSAGEERTLKVTVEPSYLYWLSDADLDNPTVKVN